MNRSNLHSNLVNLSVSISLVLTSFGLSGCIPPPPPGGQMAPQQATQTATSVGALGTQPSLTGNVQAALDPSTSTATGQRGLIRDSSTGLLVDPEVGRYYDPNTGYLVDPATYAASQAAAAAPTTSAAATTATTAGTAATTTI